LRKIISKKNRPASGFFLFFSQIVRKNILIDRKNSPNNSGKFFFEKLPKKRSKKNSGYFLYSTLLSVNIVKIQQP